MGERIFVVEDDENIREIINLALVSNGYEVVQFDNAIDALVEIDKKAPSLAIFDLMLQANTFSKIRWSEIRIN